MEENSMTLAPIQAAAERSLTGTFSAKIDPIRDAELLARFALVAIPVIEAARDVSLNENTKALMENAKFPEIEHALKKEYNAKYQPDLDRLRSALAAIEGE